MHQGVHYQGFFPKIFNTQQLDTKEYSQYQSVNPCYQNVQSKVRLGLSLPRMNVLFIPQQQDYNLTCFLYLNQSLQTVYHVSVSISFMGPKIWELLSQTFWATNSLLVLKRQFKKKKLNTAPADFVRHIFVIWVLSK